MMNNKPHTAIDAYIAESKEAILQDLARIIAVPSVRSAAEPGAPFGAVCRRALDEGAAIAEGLGLPARVEEDVVTVAEVPGESGKSIGLVAHLDVVPVGDGWDSDPYTLVRKEGWLIGRGVADDKGAAILSLYVARYFDQLAKKTGKPPRHTIKVLLGSDEENGMGDFPIWLKKHSAPDFSFTPDGDFPVCNGEKGIYHGGFIYKQAPSDFVRHLEGGIAANVVPDRAFALLAADPADLPAAGEGLCIEKAEGGAKVSATGKSGHASLPEGTVNAIGRIVDWLLANELVQGGEADYYRLLQKLLNHHDGSGLGIAADDGRFTPLTIIGGTIRTENGAITQSLDIRYPTCTNGPALTAALTARAEEAGAVYYCKSDDPPFYIAPDSAPIQALLSTYNEVTGKNAAPFLMGGGTYARHLPNAVSFGMEEEGEERPAFVGTIHAVNEGFPEERYFECLKIYILAVEKLLECDL